MTSSRERRRRRARSSSSTISAATPASWSRTQICAFSPTRGEEAIHQDVSVSTDSLLRPASQRPRRPPRGRSGGGLFGRTRRGGRHDRAPLPVHRVDERVAGGGPGRERRAASRTAPVHGPHAAVVLRRGDKEGHVGSPANIDSRPHPRPRRLPHRGGHGGGSRDGNVRRPHPRPRRTRACPTGTD